MKNGYALESIEQVYHWSEDRRSSELFKGYVSNFLRMKQEAEGWVKAGCSSETPTEEEKDAAVEYVFQQNGCIGRMRKAFVQVNPILRTLAKLFLNSLWGKFVQRKQSDYFVQLNSLQEYLDFRVDPSVNQDETYYRHIKEQMMKVRCKRKTGHEQTSLYYNIFLGACVTMWARCYIHEKMLEEGQDRICYMDTDSIIMLQSKDKVIQQQIGLGKWVDEYPRKVITKFYGLAPKSYNLVFAQGSDAIKTKGVCMTVPNMEKITHEVLDSMIESVWIKDKVKENVILDNFNISSNCIYAHIPFATMMTKRSKKIMQPVLTKRRMIHTETKTLKDVRRVRLVPLGYCETEEEEQELSELYYGV